MKIEITERERERFCWWQEAFEKREVSISIAIKENDGQRGSKMSADGADEALYF